MVSERLSARSGGDRGWPLAERAGALRARRRANGIEPQWPFDGAWYREAYPDVRNAIEAGIFLLIEHFD
jgi:hypothetical protein